MRTCAVSAVVVVTQFCALSAQTPLEANAGTWLREQRRLLLPDQGLSLCRPLLRLRRSKEEGPGQTRVGPCKSILRIASVRQNA